MAKDRKVFVSSTFIDNEQRRAVVQDAILSAGLHPVMMERFTAAHQPTVDACLAEVTKCSLYVGIVAWRYGWIPDGHEISITELEYKAAGEAGIERLMFRLSPDLPVLPLQDYDQSEDRWRKQEKLSAFVERFSSDQMPSLFREETLGLRVYQALIERDGRARGLNDTRGEVSKTDGAVAQTTAGSLVTHKHIIEVHVPIFRDGFVSPGSDSGP